MLLYLGIAVLAAIQILSIVLLIVGIKRIAIGIFPPYHRTITIENHHHIGMVIAHLIGFGVRLLVVIGTDTVSLALMIIGIEMIAVRHRTTPQK